MPSAPDASQSLHPFHLGFRDGRLEREYLAHAYPRTVLQGRLAMAVGAIVYLVMGFLDQWFVPTWNQGAVWAIRLGTVWVPFALIALSYTRHFERYCHFWLMLSGFVGGMGLIGMMSFLPLESVAYYYPSLVLITFFTYNFTGTRFIHAFCADLILIVTYNLSMGASGIPVHALASQDFFIISANLIGGAAGYLAEYQRRMLYLQERELQAERALHLERSLHDPLTGLPNRSLLYDRISQALSLAQRDGSCNAGFFVDLDDFKQINDSLGHEAGDRVLKAVAQRLREVVRETDTVSRLAGDEFFVLARGVSDEAEACRLAEEMLINLQRAVPGLPAPLRLSASLGICLFPYPGASVAGVIDVADQAMYRAKRAGKSGYAVMEGQGA